MPKNMAKINISDLSDIDKDLLTELLRIIVKDIVKGVVND